MSKEERRNELSDSNGSVTFGELISGDRFRNEHGSLWTKIDPETARSHHSMSIRLGDRGYGYRGDTMASFDESEPVKFIPPNTEDSRAKGVG